MFGRKKKQQGNSFRDTSKTKKEDKKSKSSSKKPFKLSFKRITNPIKDFIERDRNRYVVGLSCLALSIFLTISFTSFLFTWQEDQDKLETWSDLGSEYYTQDFDTEQKPKNQMGTLGAKVGNFFVYKLFGIASYSIPFLLLLAGVKLTFQRALLPFKKSLFLSFWGTLWISIAFGFAFSSLSLNLGGSFGFQISGWVRHIMGAPGLVVILAFSAALILLYGFNLKIEQLGKLFDKTIKEEVSEEESILTGENKFKTVLPDEAIVNENIPLVETPEESTPVEVELSSEPEPKIEEKTEPEDIAEELKLEEEVDVEQQPDVVEQELSIEPESTPVKEERSNDELEDLSFEVETTEEKEVLLTEEEINKKVEEFGEYDPTLDLSDYQFPKIDLLNQYDAGGGKKIDPETLEDYKNRIVETLRNYKIEIASIKATIGPTVTLYEIVPAPGVRISKIKNLEDDIALSLAALGIRIIAPIPGKGTIGIEVPNPDPDIVSMHTAISSKAFQDAKMELPIAMGKTITNETFVVDLAKMPHLLMAGATGQGKSVGLNCILVSLLYKKHPSQLKLVLVDPKKVELTLFNKVVRHFLAKLPDSEEAIITETKKVVNTVNSLCVEMDARYELLKDAHVRNIKEYNAKFKQRKLNPEKGHRFLPYIVLVIDEFADLIMTAGKEIETPIARLAQLARAIGIHLIVATQRPSVNIITGTIKANFPARIAFRVTSKIDSRTILDAGGADQLIGRGDMLLSTGNDLIRIQCAFVDTPEVEKITEFIGEQRGYPDAHLLPEYHDPEAEGGVGDIDLDDRDVLFEDAARVVVMHQQGSASLLQRKLKLGYNRAGRIVDQLEAAGIIGPFEGSKARQVLIPDDYSLEQLLNEQLNKKE